MKNIIVCIDNTYKDKELKITIGKKYTVLFSNELSYYVINDREREMGYFKTRFLPLKEYRKNKINNLITNIL